MHRLIGPRIDVDDGKSSMTKTNGGRTRDPGAAGIRSSGLESLENGLKRACGVTRRRAAHGEYSRYTAHLQSFSMRGSQRKRSTLVLGPMAILPFRFCILNQRLRRPNGWP